MNHYTDHTGIYLDSDSPSEREERDATLAGMWQGPITGPSGFALAARERYEDDAREAITHAELMNITSEWNHR